MALYLDVLLEGKPFLAIFSTTDETSSIPTKVWIQLGKPAPTHETKEVFTVKQKLHIKPCRPFYTEFNVYNELQNIVIGTSDAQALNMKVDLGNGTAEVSRFHNRQANVFGPQHPLRIQLFNPNPSKAELEFGNRVEDNLKRRYKRNLEKSAYVENELHSPSKIQKQSGKREGSIDLKKSFPNSVNANASYLPASPPYTPDFVSEKSPENSSDIHSSWDDDPDFNLLFEDGEPTLASNTALKN